MMRESLERTALLFGCMKRREKREIKRVYSPLLVAAEKKANGAHSSGKERGGRRPHDDGSIFGKKEEGGNFQKALQHNGPFGQYRRRGGRR